MTKRAIIYARVSTEAQRENYSIPEQIKSCKDYIEKMGYTLVGNHYIDPSSGVELPNKTKEAIPAFVDAFSGESYPRPIITEALDFYDTVGFDVVVIRHPDRLARDPIAKAQALYDFCQLRDAKFEFVEGGFDDTPEGILASDILTLFAKQENSRRAARSKAGKNEKAKHNLFVCGRPPYGYKINKNTPGGLEIYPEQAEIVRTIFDYYSFQDNSIREITNKLNSEKAKTAYGGLWQKSTVGRILANSTYAGYTFYNKNKVIRDKLKNKRITKKRPENEWIRIEGISPIIPLEQFELVKKKLEFNKEYIRKHPGRVYLLSGMVFCEICAKPYVCQTSLPNLNSRRNKETQFYRHRISSNHCSNRFITASSLENSVWTKVVSFLEDPETITAGFRGIIEKQKQQHSKSSEKKSEIQRGLAKLDKQLENLNKAYTDPDIRMSKKEYITQRDEIENKQTNKRAMLIKVELDEKPLLTEGEYKNILSFSNSVRKQILENVFDLPVEKKRQILTTLNTKIYISLNKSIKIELLKSFWI